MPEYTDSKPILAFRPFIDPTEAWFQRQMDEEQIVKIEGVDEFLVSGFIRLQKGQYIALIGAKLHVFSAPIFEERFKKIGD